MAPAKSSVQLAQDAIGDLVKSATQAAVAIGKIEERQTHLGASVENVSSSVKLGHDAIIVAIRESKEDLEAQIREISVNHKKLEARQDASEKKFIFVSGAASVLGAFFGYCINWIVSSLSGRHP